MTSPKTLVAKAASLAIVASLVATVPASPQESPEQQRHFIDLMSGYLDLSNTVVKMAEGRETAIYIAIEGIVEIHQKRGETDAAIAHLERILTANPDNLTVRTIVRFKLRDLYNETGNSRKALEQLDRVIAENGG